MNDARPAADSLKWTVTGPSDILSSTYLVAPYACMGITLASCIGTIILVYPRATATKHARPVLVIATAALFLIDTLNNMRVVDSIETHGAVDVMAYYIVRTFSFLLPAVTHLLAVGHRIALLVSNKATRRKFLVVLHLISLVAYVLALHSMWTIAHAVAAVGTLHYWLWSWLFPTHGLVAAVIFPISNMAACAWSIHRAFYLQRVVVTTPLQSPTPTAALPAKAPPTGTSHPTLVASTSSSSSTPTLALPPRANSAPKRPYAPIKTHASPLRTARLAPFAKSLSMSGGSIVASAQVPMMRALSAAAAKRNPVPVAVPKSPAQDAATRTFWIVSGAEILIWTVYIGLNATPYAWATVWTRNCFSAMLGSLLAVAEASLEMVYRFAYQKQEARSRAGSGRRTALASHEMGSGHEVGSGNGVGSAGQIEGHGESRSMPAAGVHGGGSALVSATGSVRSLEERRSMG